jgi:hypothetical protein
VARLTVVEALEPVIDWHRRGLVPNGRKLTDDPRCAYLNADFFALARGAGFDPEQPGRRWDAVLLDIDHTPSQLLNPAHADFYSEAGLRRLQAFLKPAASSRCGPTTSPTRRSWKPCGKPSATPKGARASSTIR